MAKHSDKSDKTVTTKSNLQTEKLQAIKVAMEQIQKQYGSGAIMRLGEKVAGSGEVDVISTGSVTLDLALGIGGLARGKVVEIF